MISKRKILEFQEKKKKAKCRHKKIYSFSRKGKDNEQCY